MKNYKLTKEDRQTIELCLCYRINKNLDYIESIPEGQRYLYQDYIKSYEEENEKMAKILDKLYIADNNGIK